VHTSHPFLKPKFAKNRGCWGLQGSTSVSNTTSLRQSTDVAFLEAYWTYICLDPPRWASFDRLPISPPRVFLYLSQKTTTKNLWPTFTFPIEEEKSSLNRWHVYLPWSTTMSYLLLNSNVSSMSIFISVSKDYHEPPLADFYYSDRRREEFKKSLTDKLRSPRSKVERNFRKRFHNLLNSTGCQWSLHGVTCISP
jgi:hypothetical protein